MIYGIWSVTIYNEQPNKNFLKLLERFKTIYKNNTDKYKMAAALVLWRDKTLAEVFSYIDKYHKKLVGEIFFNDDSPFLYTMEHPKNNKKQPTVKILLKHWVKVQLECQESKVFSKGEENKFKEVLQAYAYKNNREGYITNKEARQLFGLSNSQSEVVQLSKLFQKWKKSGFIEKTTRRGNWKIKQKPKSLEVSAMELFESIK